MAKSAAGRFISRKKKINFTLPNSKSKITINPNPIMKNTIMPIAFYAALNAKRQTLTKRITRYTEYVEHDKILCSKSEKHAHKYGNRLRNHEDKLERFKRSLAAIEATLANTPPHRHGQNHHTRRTESRSCVLPPDEARRGDGRKRLLHTPKLHDAERRT